MDIGALILMGGKNSRMCGNVKGFLKIDNVTFLEKIVEDLECFSNIYISINKNFSYEEIKEFENMGLKVIVDEYKDIGPMGGIYSTLKNCKEQYLFITGCDMPNINKYLIDELKVHIEDNVDVVLFSKNKSLYPLGAIYSKKLIPFIENLIVKGEYKLLNLIKNSNFIELPLENTRLSDEAFININTPKEYDELIKYYNK